MFGIIVCVFFLTIVSHVASVLLKQLQFSHWFNKLPGPTAWPFIGNLSFFLFGINHFVSIITALHSQYPGLFRIWLGMTPIVFVTKAEYVQKVLENTINKPYIYKRIGAPLFGNSSLICDKIRWKRHRKIIQCTFSQKILDNYMEVFSKQSELLINNLKSKLGDGCFDVTPFVEECAMKTICGTAMGIDHIHGEQKFFAHFNSEIEIILSRLFKIWLLPDMIFALTPQAEQERKNLKYIRNFVENIINTKRNKHEHTLITAVTDTPDLKNRAKKPFLEFLMEFSQSDQLFTDDDIRDEVFTFIVAGYETSAKSNSANLYCLAAFPDIQQKVYEELYEIYGDSDRPVELDDLPRMKYMEMFMKETQRHYPIIWLIPRESEQALEIDGYHLPAKAFYWINIYKMNHLKDVWGDPENFNPDRFLVQNITKRPPGSYIPFSTGPRNCIGYRYAGMFSKTILATVLRKYKLRTDVSMEEIKLDFAGALRITNGCRISLEPRKK